MRELERTSLRLKDLSEQPATSHIVLFGSETRTAVAINYWEVSDGVFCGYLKNYGDRIIAFPSTVPWMVYARDVTVEQSREQYLRGMHADSEAVAALAKELDPSGDHQPRIVVLGAGMDPSGTGGGADDERPMPMMYL